MNLFKKTLISCFLIFLAFACTNQQEQGSGWEDLKYEYNHLEKYGVQTPTSAQEFLDTFKLSQEEFAEFISYAKEKNLVYMNKFYSEQAMKGNLEFSAEELKEIEKRYYETNWEEEIKHGTMSIDFDSEKKNQRGTLTIEP